MTTKKPLLSQIDEATVQNILYTEFVLRRSNIMAIPNSSVVFGHEADLTVVTSSYLTHEFEIKVSRADFLKEMNEGPNRSRSKRNKHQVMEDIDKHMKSRYKASSIKPPNYFWFVCVSGIVDQQSIPDYAGFIEITSGGNLKHIKQPKKLHSEKLEPKTFLSIARGLMYRYWEKRIND